MGCDKRGFTLVEVLVVIAIISILSVIATPPFLRWRSNSKFIGTISNLTSDIVFAKIRAIRDNTNVEMAFDNSDRYIIKIQSNPDPPVKTINIPAGVRLDSSQFASIGRTIVFNGRGYPNSFPPSASSLSITLVSELERTVVVSLNRAGRIKVQ